MALTTFSGGGATTLPPSPYINMPYFPMATPYPYPMFQYPTYPRPPYQQYPPYFYSPYPTTPFIPPVMPPPIFVGPGLPYTGWWVPRDYFPEDPNAGTGGEQGGGGTSSHGFTGFIA